MTRLLGVELRRLFSRGLVVLTMVGAIVASLLLLLGVWQSSQPMSDSELAYAEEMYEQELERWEEHGEEAVAQCREDEEREAELTGQAVDFGCEQMAPQREWYVWGAPPLEDSMPNTLGGVAPLLVFVTALIGATFTAAELSTGSMSTWLSFEPRRLRVYASKVLAAALGVVPVALLSVLVVVTGAYLIGDHVGLADGFGSTEWADAAWTGLRLLGLGVLSALAGAALGFLLRHTAAVLGVGLVYLIGEQMVAGLLPGTRPWVLTTNISGWVRNGTVYYTDDCTTGAGGTVCEMVEHTLSFAHSAVYLLAVTVVVLAVGALVFRRRDAV